MLEFFATMGLPELLVLLVVLILGGGFIFLVGRILWRLGGKLGR